MGWFFGFKLHLVINDQGQLLQFWVTPGNIHDIKAVTRFAPQLWGLLCGDKGYISKALFERLFEQGLK